MNRGVMLSLFILFFLFQLEFAIASCSSGQVNINTADKEQLKEITYIGDARAEQIISLRPFSSVDYLIRINGIGEITLEKIKQQGLACVENEQEDEEETQNNTEDEEDKEEEEEKDSDSKEEEAPKIIQIQETRKEVEKNISREVIKLTGKSIKSNDNTKSNSKYALIGLGAFCVLLALLFIAKRRKYKNEFDG